MSVFRQRRGTAAALAAANETPAAGQIYFEIDTNRIKIGDGVRSYTQLEYLDNEVLVSDIPGLRDELDGIQSDVADIQSDPRWLDQRVPTDGSVTTAKLASDLSIDGPRYQHRRGTLADLTTGNSIPAAGEIVVETDTNRVKVGDGIRNYSGLPYLANGQQSSQATPAAILDSFAFDGTTTAFIMRSGGTAVTPATYAYVLISLNGVIQRPGVSYAIDGSLITFSAPPAATDQFFGIFIGSSAPHYHSGDDIVSGTVSAARLPGTLVYTTDSRLTDSRIPLSHKSSHFTGGADQISPPDIGAANAVHVHAISSVTGLQAALDGKQETGSYAATVHTHSASDIVSGLLSLDRIPTSIIRNTDTRLTDARTPLYHKNTHAVGGADALLASDIGAAASIHTHSMSDIYGLGAALSDRAYATHTHDNRYYTQTQIDAALATKQAAGDYAPLVHTHSISSVTGLQSALDAKATPADVTSAITSVVGAAPAALDTLQELAAALDNNASYAATITTALAGKAALSHTHTASQITDFTSAVVAAAPPTTDASLLTTGTISASRLPNTVVFTNDSRLSDARIPLSHTHDDRYYTESEVDTLLAGKQASGSYAAATHGHAIADVTGLQTALDGKAALLHAHSAADTTSGTFDIARLPVGTTSTTVCVGNDARLSDARTPTAHASTHGVSGSDPITVAASQVSGLATVATSGSYTDLSNTPSIPSAYTLPTASATVLGGVKIGSGISIDGSGVISASAGYTLPNATTSTLGGVIVGTGLGVTTGTISVTYGTSSGTACQGNDSRLSDARTPTSHASSHGSGGSDAITIAASQIGSGTIATARLPSSLVQSSNTTTTVSNTTAETNLFSYSQAASASTCQHRIIVGGTYKNAPGSSSTLTLRFKIGSTTVLVSDAINLANSGDAGRWRAAIEINMVGSSASQRVVAFVAGTRSATATWTTISQFIANGYGVATEDMSTAKTVALTCQWSQASTNTFITCDTLVVQEVL